VVVSIVVQESEKEFSLTETCTARLARAKQNFSRNLCVSLGGKDSWERYTTEAWLV